jgi:hypothetical protein
MPLPIITSTYRLAAHWIHPAAGYAVNVFHFRSTGGGDELDLGAAFNSNVASGQLDSVAEDAAVDLLEITKLDGFSATVEVSGTWTGGAAGDSPIPNAPALVKHVTGLRGPSFRGRTYLPFTSEEASEDGLLTVDTSAMSSAWNTFRTNMAADDWEFVIASYAIPVATPVTASLVEVPLATQKRRQDRLRA